MDTKSPAAQQNYYRVLNLSPTASADEIRKAISRELRMWSNRTNAPDIARRQEAERMVRILGEAETILLDDGKRKVYDRELTSLPTEQREISDAELDADEDLVAEAWRLLTNGEVPDALYVATKATERDGNNPQAWAVLAQAKFRWGETEDAIYEYKRAIRLRPNEASYYFDLGSVYESLDRAPDALQQYQRASQIDPMTTMYRAAVGVMLLKTDKIEQGTEILERCTQEEPDNASYQWFLALAYTNDAHRNWVYVPPGDERGIPSGYYATKKEHVTRAQTLIAKAERMKFNDPDLTKHIKAVHADIDKMMVRRFHGSIVTPIIGGLIYAYFSYGLGLILAPLYFWVSRPPQYALNARALRGEGGPATAMQWEPGTGFVENVAGGLFTAAIWGLFLPIMVIWNFVKFRTGDNDLGEFSMGSQGGSSNARDDAASEAKAFVAEVDVGPIARDGDASTTTAHASDDTSASHVENNASFSRNESNRPSTVVPDFGNKLSSLFSTPEGQRNALLIGIALCVVAGIAVWVLHGRITTASDNGGSLSANTASEVQLYATRLSIVRNMPTTLGSQVIAKLSRGDAVQGNWVTGSDGVHQWLRIATGAYQGGFVSGINLSPLQRPIVVRAVDQDMRLQQPAQLFGTPNSADSPLDTLQAGSTVHVTGEVEGGWIEIQRKSGGVGYLPTQSFGAAQSSFGLPSPNASSLQTALFAAAKTPDWAQVGLLLDQGANVNSKDSDGETLLILVASQYPGTDTPQTDLSLTVAERLIAHGADINYRMPNCTSCFHPPPIYGWPTIAGFTPLEFAAWHDDKRLVELLLNKGASPEIADDYGKTPLYAAIATGQLDIAEALFSRGANVNTVLRRAMASDGDSDVRAWAIAHGAR